MRLKLTILFFLLSQFAGAQSVTFTLLHVNDTHSYLDAHGTKNPNLEGDIGGIARVATVIRQIRQTEPNIIFLHAGDFFTGDLFFNKYYGVPELQILKQLGCDAIAVGNHEFDLGPARLYQTYITAFSSGSFPVVSANLNFTNFPQLSNYVTPYTIKTISGIKIGIFGETVSTPLNFPFPVTVSDSIVAIAGRTVTALQNQGADVIIFLSHLGISSDSLVARNVTGINIIVGGHDHYITYQPAAVVNPSGKTTYIVQAGEKYRYIGKMSFTFSGGNVSVNSYEIINVNSSIAFAEDIKTSVNTLKAGIVSQYGDVFNTVFANTPVNIERSSAPGSVFRDSPLGNLVTDSYRNKTGTAIAVVAEGLLQDRIYKGAVTGADIFRTVSYGVDTSNGLGFKLVTFDILGTELIRAIEYSLTHNEVDGNFFPQVSGISFKYYTTNTGVKKVIPSSVRENGKIFRTYMKYTVTANEAIYYVLSVLGIRIENINILPVTEYEALKELCSRLGTLNYKTEGRIKPVNTPYEIENVSGNGNGETFEVYQNYPNPFNPETNIEFLVNKSDFISLKIYDISGKEIYVIAEDYFTPGIYKYTVNSKNLSLASGIYFYRMRGENFSSTKKMVVAK